jgi:acetyltransferase
MAEVLSKQPRPKGPRLTILTNAGGPGVLATDALITNGGELAELLAGNHGNSTSSCRRLEPQQPGRHPRRCQPRALRQALEIAAKDENSDGLLVILTPQAMTDPTQTAEQLKPYAQVLGKPVSGELDGRDESPRARHPQQGWHPHLAYPDTAARMFDYMGTTPATCAACMKPPPCPNETAAPRLRAGRRIIRMARNPGRTMLTEYESKQLLAAYGIPTVETRIAASEDEAVIAGQIGYPVVLKLHSETITHKTDVGGVKLNLKDAAAVRGLYQH